MDTQSSPISRKHPSTKKQFDLAKLLVDQLHALGLQATLTDKCYVYSEIPANADELPAIGLIAHMDTEPVCSGKNVNPQIIEYHGGDVTLLSGDIISVSEYPALLRYVGEKLIFTDGTTLLGADDKAGVAEIMAAADYVVNHPELKHGKIGIAFTPDEEIGEGADHFDVPFFGCDYAYTVDGGPIGEISYETFNAASARFHVKGVSIHPGTAKGKMINASLIAAEIVSRFPPDETPATTEGREGFYHISGIEGGIEHATVSLIIRDHDKKRFEKRKAFAAALAQEMANKHRTSVKVEIKDSYYNCKEKILPNREIVDNAVAVLRKMGIEPIIEPVRGGTDGSRLSYMGLPCPNLGTGGHNGHSIREFISVESLEKGVEVLVGIVTRDR
ncbi:MAG: peptidase T [Christensenellaceae bacterium]